MGKVVCEEEQEWQGGLTSRTNPHARGAEGERAAGEFAEAVSGGIPARAALRGCIICATPEAGGVRKRARHAATLKKRRAS